MSREVLLNVSSSPIELADAIAIQTSAMTIDGAAATSAAGGFRDVGVHTEPPDDARDASRSAAMVLRAIAVARRRRVSSGCHEEHGRPGARRNREAKPMVRRRRASREKVLRNRRMALQSAGTGLYSAP
jgi:hypothetical protein